MGELLNKYFERVEKTENKMRYTYDEEQTVANVGNMIKKFAADYDSYVGSWDSSAEKYQQILDTAQKTRSAVELAKKFYTDLAKTNSTEDYSEVLTNLDAVLSGFDGYVDSLDSAKYIFTTFKDKAAYETALATAAAANEKKQSIYAQYSNAQSMVSFASKMAEYRNKYKNPSHANEMLSAQAGAKSALSRLGFSEKDIMQFLRDGTGAAADYIATVESFGKYRNAEEKMSSIMESPDFLEKSADPGVEGWNLAFMSTADRYQYIMNAAAFGEGTAKWANLRRNTVVGTEQAWFLAANENEARTYNYIRATEGDDAALEYAAMLKETLQDRSIMNYQKNISDFAKATPITASAVSVLGNLFYSPAAFVENTVSYLTGNGINEKSTLNLAASSTGIIRSEVSKDMSDVGKFFYNSGMSIADNIASMALSAGIGGAVGASSKVVQGITLGIMGTQSANSTILAKKAAGATDDEAFLSGIAAGVVEVATEIWSVGNFFDILENGGKQIFKKKFANVLANLGLQSFAEGSEEFVGEIADTFFDALIMKDRSEWEQLIREYKKENPGATDAEAFGHVFGSTLKSAGYNALSGAFSGLVMGGIGTVGNAFNVYQAGDYISNVEGGVDALIENAEKLGSEKQSLKNAIEEVRALDDRTSKVSKEKIGNLAVEYQNAFTELLTESMQKEVNAKLSSSSKAVKNAVANILLGETVSRSEQIALSNDAKAVDYVVSSAVVLDIADGLHPLAAQSYYKITDHSFLLVQRDGESYNVVVIGEGAKVADSTFKGLTLEQANNAFEELNKKATGLSGAEKVTAAVDIFREGAKADAVSTGPEQVNTAKDAKTAKKNAKSAGEILAISETAKDKTVTDGRYSVETLDITDGDDKITGRVNILRSDSHAVAAVNNARTVAAKSGFEVVAFTGGNIEVSHLDENGKQTTVKAAEAAISGNTVYVRADAADATAEQLAKHEIVHHQIESGQLDVTGVYQAISKSENVKAALSLYKTAFKSENALDAFEELFADAAGDINAFAGTENESIVADALAEIRRNRTARTVRESAAAASLEATKSKTAENTSRNFNPNDTGKKAKTDKKSDTKKVDVKKAETKKTDAKKTDGKKTENKKTADTKKAATKNGDIYEKYSESKKKHPDAVALVRVGDFYEVFGDDAVAVGKELDLTMTSRDFGFDERVPMVGYPVHVADQYLAKILENHDVSIMEADGEQRFIQQDKTPGIKDVQFLRSIDKKSINKFTSEEIRKAEPWAIKFYRELGIKSPFFRAWFGDWRAYDTGKTRVVEVATIELDDVVMQSGNYNIEDTGWTVYAGSTLRDETKHYSRGERISVKALSAVKNILQNSVLLDTVISKPDSKGKSPNTAFMHKLYAPIVYKGNFYIAKISVEEFYDEGEKKVKRKAYHLQGIKIEPAGEGYAGNKSAISLRSDTGSTISISDLFEFVKKFDKEFSPKPVNKALLNEDGTPKVVYHGTPNKGFTVFRVSENGALGKGIYFSESLDYAKGLSFGKEPYHVYLSIKNPYVVTSPGNYDMQKLIAQGYDGIYHKENGFWVAFEPTQIKSATDNIGTFDGENPDIKTRKFLTDEDIANASKTELGEIANIEVAKQSLVKEILQIKDKLKVVRTVGDTDHAALNSILSEATKIFKRTNIRELVDADKEGLVVASDPDEGKLAYIVGMMANFIGARLHTESKEINGIKPVRGVDFIWDVAEARAAYTQALDSGKTDTTAEYNTYLEALQTANETTENLVKAVAEGFAVDDAGNLVELEKTEENKAAILGAREKLALVRALNKEGNYTLVSRMYELSEHIDDIRMGKYSLDIKDLSDITQMIRAFRLMDDRLNKIFKDGKWLDYQEDFENFAEAEVELHGKFNEQGRAKKHSGKLFDIAMQVFQPETVAELATDENSIIVRAIKEIQKADTATRNDYLNITGNVTKFIKEHGEQKYLAHLDKAFDFEYSRYGKKGKLPITFAEFASLYMTTKREQAMYRIAFGSLKFETDTKNADKKIKKYKRTRIIDAVSGKQLETYIDKVLNGNTDATFMEVMTGVSSEFVESINKYYESLSQVDKDFIAEVEKSFVVAGELKKQADLVQYGSSNVMNGYYFPISDDKSVRSANLLGGDESISQLLANRKFSFNQNTIPKAKSPIVIRSVLSVLNNHAAGVAQYKNLSLPLENLQKIFNAKSEKFGGRSLRSYLNENVWGRDGATRYFFDYIQDLKGSQAKDMQIFNWLVGKSAVAKLGINAASILKQGTSYIALPLLSGTSMKAWGKGLVVPRNISDTTITTYSEEARARFAEPLQNVMGEQGAKLGKIGEKAMIGMEWGDKLTTKFMFSFAQQQVKVTFGYEIGTEENLKRAGKVLDELIRSVQDTKSVSTKSGFARSNNIFIRGLTLFKSANTKIKSRVFESFMRSQRLIKKAQDATNEYQEFVKSDEYKALVKAGKKKHNSTSANILSFVHDFQNAKSIYSNTKNTTEQSEKNKLNPKEEYLKSSYANLEKAHELSELGITKDDYSEYLNKGTGKLADLLSKMQLYKVKNAARKSVKKFARTFGTYITVAVMENLVNAVRAALRGRAGGDDNDWEKFGQVFLPEFIMDAAAVLPLSENFAEGFYKAYVIIHNAATGSNDTAYGFDEQTVYADFLNTLLDVEETIANTVAGKTDVIGATVSSLYALGDIFGVPARNAGNVVKSAVGVFSSTTREIIRAYEKPYQDKKWKTLFEYAINRGEYDLAENILGIIANDKTGSGAFCAAELTQLYRSLDKDTRGKIFPPDVSKTLTVNKTEYKLTNAEIAAVRKKYEQVGDYLSVLFETKEYKALSDTEKAAAVEKVYSITRELGYMSVDKLQEAGYKNKAAAFAGYYSGGVAEYAVYLTMLSGAASNEERYAILDKAFAGDKDKNEKRAILLFASGKSTSTTVKTTVSGAVNSGKNGYVDDYIKQTAQGYLK